MPQARRIAIVGGGITGLAAAFRIRELVPDAVVEVFEAGNRVGGVLQTRYDDGRLMEQSADNFITNVPWGLDLCRRLGMEAELLPTDEARRRAFVVHRGKLVSVPDGFLLMAPSRIGPIVSTPLLSFAGKLRLLAEWFVPARKSSEDESLGSFVRRRFGREVFDRLVQPLVGGIYTADPEKLSVAATMPRFQEMERTSGGLLRASLKQARREEGQASGARYSMFVAPRQGMASLIERLVSRLPAGTIRLNNAVTRIVLGTTGHWQLTIRAAAQNEPVPAEVATFDGVIIATPAYRAASLLESVDGELAKLLDQIPYAGTSLVSLVYRRADIGHPLDGFGLVVPAVEQRQILSASFASNKYPGRVADDEVLIRVFIGGACQPELAELPDDRLRSIAVTELAELLQITGEPHVVQINRWPRSMPQYHVGHLNLVEQIEARVNELPGLALAGSAYRGVGVPLCIHSGEQAAEQLQSSRHTGYPLGHAATATGGNLGSY